MKRKPPVEGPIDDFVLAKIRNALDTLTEPKRVAASINEALPGMSPDTVAELSVYLSNKLRAVLLPLVK